MQRIIFRDSDNTDYTVTTHQMRYKCDTTIYLVLTVICAVISIVLVTLKFCDIFGKVVLRDVVPIRNGPYRSYKRLRTAALGTVSVLFLLNFSVL